MSKRAEKKAAKAAAARQAAVENRVVDAGDWLAKEIGALAPRLQDGVRSGAISLAGGIHTAMSETKRESRSGSRILNGRARNVKSMTKVIARSASR